MPKLYLAHPDPAIRAALAQTVQSAWPEVTLVGEADKAELYLGVRGESTPPDSTVFLDDGPDRLSSLIQRLRALSHAQSWPRQVSLGAHNLDTMTRHFERDDGTSCDLTEKETSVIVYLAQRKAAATREDLLRDVWRYADGVDTHTIETHIYRLRQKIEPNPDAPEILITTKDGYQLAALSKA